MLKAIFDCKFLFEPLHFIRRIKGVFLGKLNLYSLSSTYLAKWRSLGVFSLRARRLTLSGKPSSDAIGTFRDGNPVDEDKNVPTMELSLKLFKSKGSVLLVG